MPVNEQKIMQAIYDNLFSAFTSPPTGINGSAISQKDHTYLTLNWPGQPIAPADYSGPYDVATKKGKMNSVENFSRLVDDIQSLYPITSPLGRKISDVYASVVNANVPMPPVSEQDEAAYNKANKVLNLELQALDDNEEPLKDSDGKLVKTYVDSPLYKNYKRKVVARDNAMLAFITRYQEFDMSKPEDQRKWAMMGPTLLSAVTMAQDDLQGAQQKKIEDAVAALAQSSRNQVGQVFSNAQKQFSNMRLTSGDGLNEFRPSYAIPSNWYDTEADNTWTSIKVDSKSLKTEEHSDFSKFSIGNNSDYGLWSFGASVNKDAENKTKHSLAENLTVSFDFLRVTISRPWMNALLFNLGGWSIPQSKGIGSISNGTREQAGPDMPLLTTSFIVARNVKITGDWTESEKSDVSNSLNGNTSIGWGPFALKGSFANSSKDKKSSATFDGKTISAPGMQIIAWVNTVVPLSPPMA